MLQVRVVFSAGKVLSVNHCLHGRTESTHGGPGGRGQCPWWVSIVIGAWECLRKHIPVQVSGSRGWRVRRTSGPALDHDLPGPIQP